MLLARVRRTILERNLIEPGMRVLCACSGGPDSAALLVSLARLAEELDFQVEAASVDHGLRADACDDVAIAREQAAMVGVAFHALRVCVEGGASLQAQARSARYAALMALAGELGAARLATGHTRDDQAETVLMRILRGAGMRGLGGIQVLREDGVVRPLIDCRREIVAQFARASCPRIAADVSNHDTRFERTRVRHGLLPVLEREDAALVDHLAQLADDARSASAALLACAEPLLPRDEGAETIDLSLLAQAPAAVARAGLSALLGRRTGQQPGRSQLEALERALGRPGEVWLPGGWLVRGAGDGRLQLIRRTDEELG